MALLSLSSVLSIDTWFSCNNLSIGWLIFIEFCNKVPNHKWKVSIDKGVMTLTVLELEAKKGLQQEIIRI